MLATAGSAHAASPALTVAAEELERSVACEGDLAAGAPPVLLVPGTGEDPDFFATNYVPALRKLGLAFCTVTLPAQGTGDIPVAAEHVVFAIRTMHARAGRRIAIIGHSQGGMVPRWAFKYFPDTRAMVDDLVGLASSNHGTTAARSICGQGCNAASQQQRDDSNFIRALNDGPETWPGISYTSVFTRYDEVVTPNQDAETGSTALRTGEGLRANVATQDVCPSNTSEHLALGSTDPVGYALAVDALANAGPADPTRIAPSVCLQVAQPGVNPVTGAADTAAAFAKVLAQFAGGEVVQEEPPLRCYVTATCADGAGGRAALRLRADRRCFDAARPAFGFTLRGATRARYVIQRRVQSPRWQVCPPRGGRRAGTYVTVGRGSTGSGARAAAATLRFTVRRRLAPGTYLLRVTAADGRAAKVKFWVVDR